SCLASEGDGGPCGRRWRNGRSPRSVLIPDAANLSASATSSGALQLPPAPWVSTSKPASVFAARCRNPRTGASPGVSSTNASATRFITMEHSWPVPSQLACLRRDRLGQALSPQLPRLARHDDLRRVDGLRVQLHLDYLAAFVDQVIHPPRGLVLRVIETVLLGHIAAPVAEQGEGNANLFRPRLVREGRIHAHTQHLGIGSFQLAQVLLESLHLLGSTTGEGEDVEGQGDVLLTLEVVQRNLDSVLVLQGEIRRHVAHLDLGRRGLARLVGCLARSQK